MERDSWAGTAGGDRSHKKKGYGMHLHAWVSGIAADFMATRKCSLHRFVRLPRILRALTQLHTEST
jgi:hypothetical protein